MAPPRTLQGRIALITGASRGIGLAIAKALAREGCLVAITGRDRKALQTAERALKKISPAPQILAHPADVRDPQSVAALFAAVKKQFARLDILINNAGISHAMAEVQRLPLDTWRAVIETDLTGMFVVTQAALPLLRRGGTIVNNLSMAATSVFAGQSAYCAAKHGALGVTRTLREELRPRGIRVIALMPGATDTEIWNQFWPDAPR
ncbi:MAG TPA: SDR family NAD(P)-dependent oxidoreductase, partial [Terriglobales bacterium]|nr:SDR family NAD(P)-dependent oxidoreductase [Terriglobales bacterium]